MKVTSSSSVARQLENQPMRVRTRMTRMSKVLAILVFIGGIAFDDLCNQWSWWIVTKNYTKQKVSDVAAWAEQQLRGERPVPKAIPVKELQPPRIVRGPISENFVVFGYHDVSPAAINSVLCGAMQGKANTFIEYAKRYNLSPAFLAGICRQESGGGNSHLALSDMQNVMGVFEPGGRVVKDFDSVEESVLYVAERLANSKLYPKGNRATVASIQTVYCPVGAKNDPKGLNKHWRSGVVRGINQILAYDQQFLAQR